MADCKSTPMPAGDTGQGAGETPAAWVPGKKKAKKTGLVSQGVTEEPGEFSNSVHQ